MNAKVLSGIVERQRRLHPRIFEDLNDRKILALLGVVRVVDGEAKPTLAGLLAAGTYPQQFFPRLLINCTTYPGTSKEEMTIGERSYRYLDTMSAVGSVPEMMREALEFVGRNMKTGAVIVEGLRYDAPECPLVAVREAVANALMHRDYSPEGRGSPVELNIYADRIEVVSPGGLYGAASVDGLLAADPPLPATRNVVLAHVLETTPFADGFVVENRSSGFIAMRQAMNRLGLEAPKVRENLRGFRVSLMKRAAAPGGRQKTTGMTQGRSGGGRASGERRLKTDKFDDELLAIIGGSGDVQFKELVEKTGRSPATVRYRLKKLVLLKLLEETRIPGRREVGYKRRPAPECASR